MNEQTTITIDKAYYDFLLEKAKERCDLYSENRVLRYKLEQKETSALPEMTKEQWALYYDFIKNRWYPLVPEQIEDECKLAMVMMKRTECQQNAFDRFVEMSKERDSE